MGEDEKREEGRGRVVGIFTIQTTRESLKMSCNGLTKTYYKLFRASELSRIQWVNIICEFINQFWQKNIKLRLNYSVDPSSLLCVNIHFRDTFFISPTQSIPTSLWAQFMYHIIFYSFKHGSSPCNSLGKLRKCDLEGMGRFLLDLLHEPSSHVLPSGLGTQVAP